MLSMVAVTSCENGLSSTSPSILTEEQVYSDYNLAEMGVLSIYEMLTVQYSHRDRYLPWYGFNTDIECYSSTSDSDKTRIAQYYTNAGSKEMDNANGNSYNNLVSGIERANLAIRGLEAYADLTDPDMRYLRAEAITARAFLYVELLKAYGEVPARFEPINNDNMYINKSDKDVIPFHMPETISAPMSHISPGSSQSVSVMLLKNSCPASAAFCAKSDTNSPTLLSVSCSQFQTSPGSSRRATGRFWRNRPPGATCCRVFAAPSRWRLPRAFWR